MNARWHRQNPMPRNPSLEERIAWHLEHQKECGCRPIPESVKGGIKKRKPR